MRSYYRSLRHFGVGSFGLDCFTQYYRLNESNTIRNEENQNLVSDYELINDNPIPRSRAMFFFWKT